MSDLVRALAFAFRRKGAEAVPGPDLRFVLAFDLRWLAPEDAKRAILRALQAGLLREDGDLLRPTFDVHAIEVPLNFRPGVAMLDEPIPADLPAPRAAALTPPAPAPPSPAPSPLADAAALEERARRGHLVSLEAARLIVARREGRDVREEAARAAQRMLGA